jgi:hypothetical protein
MPIGRLVCLPGSRPTQPELCLVRLYVDINDA